MGKAIVERFLTGFIALNIKPEHIFEISSEQAFRELSMAVFQHQAEANPVYRTYLSSLKIDPKTVNSVEKIPFLPIEFFKTHPVYCEDISDQTVFTSSGTGGQQSRHYVKDVGMYEKSYRRSFELFYGDIKDYAIFSLLPSYMEREGSSLIYMVNDLIKLSGNKHSQFYLNNLDEMSGRLLLREAFLQRPENLGKKNLLLGVTYALLDLIEAHQFNLKSTIVMETGGMKGKRKEMVREELHQTLCKGFDVTEIHSEYGMTELLSQAYSKGKGKFNCPPWMKILIRETNDPFALLPASKSGGINVIDLANLHSCSFIATQDLGKVAVDGSFEVLGRFDNSDIRGCNLMVE